MVGPEKMGMHCRIRGDMYFEGTEKVYIAPLTRVRGRPRPRYFTWCPGQGRPGLLSVKPLLEYSHFK